MACESGLCEWSLASWDSWSRERYLGIGLWEWSLVWSLLRASGVLAGTVWSLRVSGNGLRECPFLGFSGNGLRELYP